mmetsp:Transcript_19843/g.55168  ORF Transcript_19843/g.55168 Transcript_19843/m.55168 type:complete len:408 (+) Transcript_19843:775-1998(+)
MYNLATGPGTLDLESDPTDVRLHKRVPDPINFTRLRPGQPIGVDIPLDYSLRAYLAVLWKLTNHTRDGATRFFINRVPVHRLTVEDISICDKYRYMLQEMQYPLLGVKVLLGLRQDEADAGRCGIHFYYRDRLISPYMRLGAMSDPTTGPEVSKVGMTVVVCNADALTPHHLKQDFEDDMEGLHGLLMQWLAEQINAWWYEKGANIDTWVQCDKCGKWRRLPSGSKASDYDGLSWECTDHPECITCEVKQELLTSDHQLRGDNHAPAGSHESITSPNIPRLLFVDFDAAAVGFENCGDPLLDYLGRVGHRPVLEDRLNVLRGVALGLQELHQNRLFHGRLAPSKVLVDRGHRPYIIGFGFNQIQHRSLCLDTGPTQLPAVIYQPAGHFTASTAAQASAEDLAVDVYR